MGIVWVFYAHAHCTSSGCGKRRAHSNIGSWVTWIGSSRLSSYLWELLALFRPILGIANAIGTQLRSLINSALARWRMTVLMETVAESGEGGVESRKYAPNSAWVWRMSRLTRDGTAEPNSRHQTLRRERGQGKSYFPCSADHEQDWQPYPVDAQSAKSDDHTHTDV